MSASICLASVLLSEWTVTYTREGCWHIFPMARIVIHPKSSLEATFTLRLDSLAFLGSKDVSDFRATYSIHRDIRRSKSTHLQGQRLIRPKRSPGFAVRKHYDDAVQELIEAKADVSWLQPQATDHRWSECLKGVLQGEGRQFCCDANSFIVLSYFSFTNQRGRWCRVESLFPLSYVVHHCIQKNPYFIVSMASLAYSGSRAFLHGLFLNSNCFP